ncbi:MULTISPECIES: TetR/AcrR family transcriptional regulator [unclassified Streptomyces]|uniref:TetR/AcrR family transcriptional regulator n=1 Tax=Streptomyces sp. ST1020 TaxID=1848901 RepID=UPI000DD7B9C7|nr:MULTISPECIES: TetR/AcrR family transcriptional regulator [unclassified Streptomyces]QZZ31467.1 TetR/AcrR family transcriptional regulator [Streptomyces sp. ST1015]
MSAVPVEPAESPEPAWRQRAVERSTRAAKLRAEQRVQRFLDAAQELIAGKGTTDFTVQEVVERSRQSLRSFYQHFDGKHELLLALFEDALSRSAGEIREAAAAGRDPLEKLRIAVELLYRCSEPRPGAQSPLFTDFAIQLLVTHPDQVATAHLPLLGFFTELVEEAVAAGQATAPKPRRVASLIMQTAMFTARAPAAPVGAQPSPISAEEVWAFCVGGITGAPAAAPAKKTRSTTAKPPTTAKSPATAKSRAASKSSTATKSTAGRATKSASRKPASEPAHHESA